MQLQYDPSLYIGCLVEKQHLEYLQNVSRLHNEISSKKEALSNMKKVMSEFEMYNHDTLKEKGVQVLMEDMKKCIREAQGDYMEKTVENLEKLSEISRSFVTHSMESPINWELSKLKSDLPISADTMKCDARWFKVDKNDENASKHADDVCGHIGAALAHGIGVDIAYKSKRSQEKLGSRSSICSTLVITCSCTHKNAMAISPCVFDSRKLVEAWNTQFPKKRINRRPDKKREEGKERLYLVSGATYASALVGMVTFVDESHKHSSLDNNEWQRDFEGNMKYLQALSMEREMKNSNLGEVMSMVANQTVSVHFNLYCSGIIPNLEKQELKTKVEMLSALDTENLGIEMEELLEALGQGNTTQASVLNMTTLMNAFDNYLSLATGGDTTVIGVPVNYFLRPLSKRFITELLKNENENPARTEPEDLKADV